MRAVFCRIAVALLAQSEAVFQCDICQAFIFAFSKSFMMGSFSSRQNGVFERVAAARGNKKTTRPEARVVVMISVALDRHSAGRSPRLS